MVESAQRTICRPFAKSSIPVVRCTHANLRYRPSTFRAFQTSPLPQQATVATRLRRASPSVSGPSATRRALGQSPRGSLWWSPPLLRRGRGTGWGRNLFGAQREQDVCRWMTPLTREIPAPSGAAATTPCQHACSRLIIAGVRSLVLVHWLVGLLARLLVNSLAWWLVSLSNHWLSGSLACSAAL